MRETPGINPFRNGPNQEKAERMAASRWTRERTRIPLFAEQIPAPDPDAIIVEYSCKAEDWSEWSGASSDEVTVSGKLWPIESRPRSLPTWTRSDANSRAILPTGPTFGGGNWSSSLVASYKGNRLRNEVAAKSIDQRHLAFHMSRQAHKRLSQKRSESAVNSIAPLHPPPGLYEL